jgi:chromosome partitioning protein
LDKSCSVPLIDTDPQGSLSAWWNARTAEVPKLAPMTIAELPEKLELLDAAGYGVAIIDTPPAITEANQRCRAIGRPRADTDPAKSA